MILARSGSRVAAKAVADLFKMCAELCKLLMAILASLIEDAD